MLVATTMLGLIPLAIGNTQIGGDGPHYYPMARAIVGGLLFATVVTLVILPSIYVMLDDLRGTADCAGGDGVKAITIHFGEKKCRIRALK